MGAGGLPLLDPLTDSGVVFTTQTSGSRRSRRPSYSVRSGETPPFRLLGRQDSRHRPGVEWYGPVSVGRPRVSHRPWWRRGTGTRIFRPTYYGTHTYRTSGYGG